MNITSPRALLGAWWDETVSEWAFSERALFVVLFMLAHESAFTGLNLILAFIDWSGVCQRWKIQPTRYPSPPLVWRTMRKLVFAHAILQPIALWFVFPLIEDAYRVSLTVGAIPDSWWTVCWEVAFCFAINETGFYWAHRALHESEWLYKRVHSVHHLYGTPIGISAEYAHPVEQVLANYLPTLGGPVVLLFWRRSSILVLSVYLWLRIAATVENHSGYHFPWSVQRMARAHDFHHSHGKGMFGAQVGFWDWLCGTDRAFAQHCRNEDSNNNKHD